jgi:hypothetical protein
VSAATLAANASLRPYEALFEHVELELELAGRGEIEALAAMGSRWESLISELPQTPPAAAAGLLERAKLVHDRTRVELIRLRESVVADLGTTKQARRAANGYAGQLSRRPRVDRRA